MSRNVHHEHVADAPARAQSRVALRDRREELVGMETPFHEQLGAAGTHDLYRLFRGRLSMRHVNELKSIDVEVQRSCCSANSRFGANENWGDDSRLSRLKCSPQ